MAKIIKNGRMKASESAIRGRIRYDKSASLAFILYAGQSRREKLPDE